MRLAVLFQLVVAGAAIVGGIAALAPVPGLGWARIPGRVGRWTLGPLTVLGGLVLAVGAHVPFFTFFAASLLVLVLVARMVVARSLPLVPLLLAVVAVGVLQPLGLKVLLLPKADKLPYEPAAASVVKTYGDGMWFEGIAAGADGTLYLSESKGEDYAAGDKSRVHAEVIARAPDGTERTYLALPTGDTAGVMALAADNTMYLTVTGRDRGLWRVTPNGDARRLAALPQGSFPNGVTLGPKGQVYVADSNLGTIWRIDPTSGAVDRAYRGKVLQARRFVALPPGANGIHYVRGQMYVTNSDSGTLLRFSVTDDGLLRDPQVLVTGVPADDFAVADDGTVYLTTHIYNTLVKVTPDGRRVVIADKRQHLIGATDCIIVPGRGGTATLYAVTDGGALATGDKNAAGTLVAVTLSP